MHSSSPPYWHQLFSLNARFICTFWHKDLWFNLRISATLSDCNDNKAYLTFKSSPYFIKDVSMSEVCML